MKILLLLLVLSTCLQAQILRLCRVVEKPGPGISQHEFGDQQKQTILIEDEVFITEKDVLSANPSPAREYAIDITLSEAGADMSAEDFDFIKFIEDHKFSLKDGETEPTEADVFQLINALYSVSSGLSEGSEGIDPTCDAVSLVAPRIPELKELIKKHPNTKISLSDLNRILKPYIFYEKSLF